MTRKQAEERILRRLEEIAEIAREYNPKCYHLSMYIIGKSANVTCTDEETGKYLIDAHNGRFPKAGENDD